MHILIVTQYFWPENFQINNLAIDLKNQGHEVTVLTGIPNYPEGSYYPGYGWFDKNKESYHGITIKRVPVIPRGNGGGFRLALNYFSFAFFASILGPFKCRGRCDVIFVFMPSPITVGLPARVLKKIKKAPILFWVQDLWPDTLVATGSIKSKNILKWIKKLTQSIYHSCDRILVQSKAFIASIEQLGEFKHKLFYFPNAVEDFYRPISPCEGKSNATNLPSGFKIMYGGNIGTAQSFETILQTAILLKDIKDIQWIIIGEGRQKNWLIDQIANQGIGHKFHFIQHQLPEMMPYYFSQADALLVSLKKEPVFSLTIPSKLQCYLASGKPIIASLDGEAARIIDEAGAGIASPAEDAHALAKNILILSKMELAERELMGQKGRLYAEQHFDRKRLVTQLESWMIETVGE